MPHPLTSCILFLKIHILRRSNNECCLSCTKYLFSVAENKSDYDPILLGICWLMFETALEGGIHMYAPGLCYFPFSFSLKQEFLSPQSQLQCGTRKGILVDKNVNILILQKFPLVLFFFSFSKWICCSELCLSFYLSDNKQTTNNKAFPVFSSFANQEISF